MAKAFLTHLDLRGNQLLQAAIEVRSSSDPASGVVGQICYRSDLQRLRVCTAAGTPGTWATVQGGAVTSADIADGTIVNADISASAGIALSKLATDPLARANHTGTQTAATISDFATVRDQQRLDQHAAPTASVSLNNQKLTNVGAPTVATDAATKGYVDVAVQGIRWLGARVASTANVNIASPGTAIDGVTLANGDYVLLKNQATAAQNGLYIFNGSAAAMTRAPEMDTAAEADGRGVLIEDGAQAGTIWITTSDVVTLGTDAISFSQFNKATDLVGGNGLTLTGTTLDVNVDNSTIEINADILRVKDGGITSAKIADGTIVNADVSGTAAIAYSKLSLAGSIVNADVAAGAAIALSKLATDPLARANHTGTQLASTISNFDTQVRTSRLDQMAAPTAAVSLNSQKVTNLATPTAATDAATKAYVDADGWKIPVVVASQANATIASPGATIDGVTLSAGDRVLLTAQTTQSQNGIYDWNGASSPMTRSADALDATLLPVGSRVSVKSGTYAGAVLAMTGSFAASTWTSNVVLSSAASVSGNATGQVALLAGATTYFFDPSNGLAMQGKRITGLGDPTAAQDAATKGYVDTNGAQTLAWKKPVMAVATANMNVAAPGAYKPDNLTPTAGDRLLLTAQTTVAENGIWVWNGAAVPMTRATDADSAAKVGPGATVFAIWGVTHGATVWRFRSGDFVTQSWSKQIDLSAQVAIYDNANGVVINCGGTLFAFDASNGLSMGGTRIRNLEDPQVGSDAATKDYVDIRAASGPFVITGNGTQTQWTLVHAFSMKTPYSPVLPLAQLWETDNAGAPTPTQMVEAGWEYVDDDKVRLTVTPAPAAGVKFIALLSA